MNALWLSIIPYLILLSIPFLSMLVVWLYYQLERCLPAQQREALEQFARIAVQKIEQQHTLLSGTAKKQLAIDLVVKLFNTFKIAAPPLEIIDIAIEAGVFAMGQLPTGTNVEKLGPQNSSSVQETTS